MCSGNCKFDFYVAERCRQLQDFSIINKKIYMLADRIGTTDLYIDCVATSLAKENHVWHDTLKTHNSQFRYTKMSKVHCLVIIQE